MHGTDKDELDQIITQALKNLAMALAPHGKGPIELHSQASHSLVEQRRTVANNGRGARGWTLTRHLTEVVRASLTRLARTTFGTLCSRTSPAHPA